MKKFKARFCVRGDCQEHGIDFFDTWSPLVQWLTIWMMFLMSLLLNLTSFQAYITEAFLHAHLPPNETIYLSQPRGFTGDKNYVLKLNRSLYGLKQAPRYFFQYLKERLEKNGCIQSKL